MMSSDESISDDLSWKIIKNNVSKRMVDDSLIHNFQGGKKIHKVTKIVNREIKKYSGLKSYRQFVEIKTAVLHKLAVEESDYKSTSKLSVLSENCQEPNGYSSDQESESDSQHEDLLITENIQSFLHDGEVKHSKSSKPSSNRRKIKTKSFDSQSFRSISTKHRKKSDQPSTSQESIFSKLNVAQTKLTSFIQRKNSLSSGENLLQEEIQIEKENKTSKKLESSSKTRVSPRKTSKSAGSNKTSSMKRNMKNINSRSKTREDVKKNLSTVIGNCETRNIIEEHLDTNKLDDTQNDSALSFSNIMAVAQSTQYPDDSLDISSKTDKRVEGNLPIDEDENQQSISNIDEQSIKESVETRESISENGILDVEKNADDLQKEKHPPKIIGSEIVNKKYKILGKESEDRLLKIPDREKESEQDEKIEKDTNIEEAGSKTSDLIVMKESEGDTEDIKKFIIQKPEGKAVPLNGIISKRNEQKNTRELQKDKLEKISKVQDDSSSKEEINMKCDDRKTEKEKEEKEIKTKNQHEHERDGNKDAKKNQGIKENEENSSSSEEEEEEEDETKIKKIRSDIENKESNEEFDDSNTLVIDESRKDESSGNDEDNEDVNLVEEKILSTKIVNQLDTKEKEESIYEESIEKIESENEMSGENNSREVLTQILYRKNVPDSEDEKQDDEELKLTLENDELECYNLDDDKITIQEHKITIPENLGQKDEEDEEIMSVETMKRLQQRKRLNLTADSDSSSSDEEPSQNQIYKNKQLVRKPESDSDSEETDEDIRKKSPIKESLKTTPKKIGIENKSSQKKYDSNKKEISSDAVKPTDEDRDFENYIREGINFLQQQKDKISDNLEPKKKSRKNSREFSDKENGVSSSQIIEDTQTQDFSQIISDPDSHCYSDSEGRKSNKNRMESDAECLKYVLSNLQKKNIRKNHSHQDKELVVETQSSNKSQENTIKEWKKITQLEELVEKDNLIENNLTSTLILDDISDNDEVWLFELPRKEISKDLMGKEIAFNGTKLSLGKNTYKTSYKKLDTVSCVFSSKKPLRPYKTVNFRPVGSIVVRGKITKGSSNNVSDETDQANTEREERTKDSVSIVKKTKNKKRKLSNDVSFSNNHLISEESNPESTIPKKHKKKVESYHDTLILGNHEKKKKLSHTLSDSSEEEEKPKPLVGVKRKKSWDINEYALDEKPSVLPEKTFPKILKRLKTTGSDSSEVEVLDKEIKPKKKRKKEKDLFNTMSLNTSEASALTVEKEKKWSKNILSSESTVKKEEKYSMLDVSKVKVKKNKEQVDSDLPTDENVKKENCKKKKAQSFTSDNFFKLESKEDKLKSKVNKIFVKPEKEKKSSKEEEKLSDVSTETKIDQKEDLKEEILKSSKSFNKNQEFLSLKGKDSSSEFEIKDKKKSEKKKKKKLYNTDELMASKHFQNQQDVKHGKDKTHKKMRVLIDFDH